MLRFAQHDRFGLGGSLISVARHGVRRGWRFNKLSARLEKLNYMHGNPVQRGLVSLSRSMALVKF